MAPSIPLHHTTLPSPKPNSPHHSRPTLLTLDIILHVLRLTVFHPFLSALLPLCLRAVAAPYDSTSFILTSAFAVSVCAYRLLEGVNQRVAYGVPRRVSWVDEVVVVTGGLGGLGGCLAEIFALKGVAVAVLDVAVGGVGDGEEKEGVKYYRCDVGSFEEASTVWERVRKDLGTPTILINNAAVVNGKPFLEQTQEEVEQVFRINTLSHYHLTRLFLPPLLTRPTGGSLITISSVLASLGASHLSAYAASKAALSAYHASLTAELSFGAPQVKTILVAPGQLDTRMFHNVKLRGWLRNFLAPVVGAGELAVRIVEMVDRGDGGVVSEPAYARWIAWLHVLPAGMERVARGCSGLDEAFSAIAREEKLKDAG